MYQARALEVPINVEVGGRFYYTLQRMPADNLPLVNKYDIKRCTYNLPEQIYPELKSIKQVIKMTTIEAVKA